MTEQADKPPKSETAPEVVAHAPDWMVDAFGMGNLVKAGLMVAEPSPAVIVRQVGKQVVPVPPKSAWRPFRVNVKDITLGTIDVLAPDIEAARDATEQYCENGDDMDAVDWGDRGDGFFVAGADVPTDITEAGKPDGVPVLRGEAEANIVYDPEMGYVGPADPADPPRAAPTEDPDQADRDAGHREDAGLPP
jgi:hypothetical protein